MTMVFCADAQCDAFFMWNDADNETFRYIDTDAGIKLPAAHGVNYDCTAPAVPLGSGLLVLTALGVGYVMKRNKRE